MTDQKIQTADQLAAVYQLIEKSGRPLLIWPRKSRPPCIVDMLSRREKNTSSSPPSTRRTTAIGAKPCSRTSPSPPAAR